MTAADEPVLLRLSAEVAIPLTAVTETFAVLGKRGTGRTTAAVVLTEELIGAGQPVIVVDPVGVWWGCAPAPTASGQACRW